MATNAPASSSPASHFRISIGGKEVAGRFRECTGLDAEMTVIEDTTIDAQGHPIIRKAPGPKKWSNITMKRGVDGSTSLYKWYEEISKAGPEQSRVDGFIELCDYSGKPVARWKFIRGWPLKYVGASLDPKSSEIAVEEIQIAHEGLERDLAV